MGAAAVALAALLAGCTGTPTHNTGGSRTTVDGATTGAKIESLEWSLGAAADSLDIARSFTSSTGVLSSLGYDTLVILDHDLQVSPWIATMTEVSPTEYTFELADDVTFWDGTPLTADDVVWSYTRHFDPALKSIAGSILSTVDTVEAVDDETVRITLTRPDPTFKYSAAIIQIFNKAQGEEVGDAFGSPDAIPLGTGQYVLTDYTTGGGITGTLNENYWGEAPAVQKIHVSIVENAETARIAIQQGESNGRFDVPNGQLSQWSETPGVRTGTASGLNPLMLRIPITEAPFDDLNVRKALAYAIDREGVVKSLYGGAAEVATSLATRGHWRGVMENDEADEFFTTLPNYSFDLDAAAEALAASSVPDGFSADIVVAAGNSGTMKTASAIAASAAEIGITLNVKQVPLNELAGDYLLAPGNKKALVVSSTAPTYPDPTDMMLPFLEDDPAIGYLNASGFADPEAQELLDAQSSASGAERLEMLKRIAVIAQEDLPLVPIAWVDATVGLSENLRFNNFDAFSYYRPWVQDIGVAAE